MTRTIALCSLIALSGCLDGEGVIGVARAQQALTCNFYCSKKLSQATIDGVVYPACLSPDNRFPPLESATFTDGRMVCPTDAERGGKCDACDKQIAAQAAYLERLRIAAEAAAAALPDPGVYVNPATSRIVFYDDAGKLWTVVVVEDLVSNPLTLLPTLTKVVLKP